MPSHEKSWLKETSTRFCCLNCCWSYCHPFLYLPSTHPPPIPPKDGFNLELTFTQDGDQSLQLPGSQSKASCFWVGQISVSKWPQVPLWLGLQVFASFLSQQGNFPFAQCKGFSGTRVTRVSKARREAAQWFQPIPHHGGHAAEELQVSEIQVQPEQGSPEGAVSQGLLSHTRTFPSNLPALTL